MKLLVVLILFFTNNYDIAKAVEEFHNIKTKEQENHFIEKYKNETSPEIQGYYYAIKMKKSKYKFFPWEKIKVFNKNRDRIEALIKKHPDNVDLRYVRLILQLNTPRFLGYHENIESDIDFIRRAKLTNNVPKHLMAYIEKNIEL